MNGAIKKAVKWIFAGGCVVTLGALLDRWHQEYLESERVRKSLEDTEREIMEKHEALMKQYHDMHQQNLERLEWFNEWQKETEAWFEEQEKLDQEQEESDAE